MKRLFYFCVAALLICNACNAQKGYVIRGSFPGLQDGMTVTLRNLEGNNPQTLAECTVQNGQFELRGYTPSPVYCDLVFKDTSKEKVLKNFRGLPVLLDNCKGISVFLDNSEMQVEAPHLDSLAFTSYLGSDIESPNVQVTGGTLQAEYIAYRKAVYAYEREAKQANDTLVEYSSVYPHYPLEVCIKKYDYFYPIKATAEQQKDSLRMAFIRQHPTSPLSSYFAEQLLNTDFTRTQAEVEELARFVANSPDTSRQTRLAHYAKIAENKYKGITYHDLELIIPTGKTVKLSDLIQAGNYTLIDFWASWCKPCRATIPTISEIYKHYNRQQLNVLSISIDEKQADWEQAMKEENMPWQQARIGSKESSDITNQKYGISTIPRFVLISPQGKVIFYAKDLDAMLYTIKHILD